MRTPRGISRRAAPAAADRLARTGLPSTFPAPAPDITCTGP